jgi:hypothetical protein
MVRVRRAQAIMEHSICLRIVLARTTLFWTIPPRSTWCIHGLVFLQSMTTKRLVNYTVLQFIPKAERYVKGPISWAASRNSVHTL